MKNIIISLLIIAVAFELHAQQNDTIQIPLKDISLYSILSQPKNASTIAIFMPGSGPTDHNGNQPGLFTNSLKYLAEHLKKNNIATLRFDKRGIANSAYKDFKESDLSIDQYATDLVKVVQFAKSKGYKKVFIIGHSEGSLIALITLQKIKADGFISISGAGQPADVILKKQLKPQLPESLFTQAEIAIDSLKLGYQVKNAPQQLFMLFRPSVQPYLISWFKYSPTELISNLEIPILVLNGTKDLQVDIENAKLLSSSNKKAELVFIENMNHVLKTITGDLQENMQSYSNPNLEINTQLAKEIVEFINKQL